MTDNFCVSFLPMPEILHIIDSSTSWDMLRQLSQIAQPGETIASLGSAKVGPELQGRVVAVHRPLGLNALASPKKTLAHADAVHAWSFNVLDTAAGWACHYQCPLVLSLPHLPESKVINRLKGYFPNYVKQPHLPDRHFAITVPDENTFNALVSAGLPQENVKLLPPPQDSIEISAEARRTIRTELGLSDSDILLYGGGEMIRQTGLKFAIWAQAILRQIMPNIRLIIPGSGKHESSIKYFASTTGYKDEIFFTGDCYSFEQVLAASDIATFLYGCDSGIAALAGAMQAGLPIVASDVPQIKNVFLQSGGEQNPAALIVPPESPRLVAAALLKLIEQPQLAAELAQRAKQIASQNFSRLRSREILDSIYSPALIKSSSGAI